MKILNKKLGVSDLLGSNALTKRNGHQKPQDINTCVINYHIYYQETSKPIQHLHSFDLLL